MPFANPDTEQILQLLNRTHSVAVVGLSPNPARPSFLVAQGLQTLGYRIIPVRPRHSGAEPSGAVMAAPHLLPQTAGYAITSDLASVVGSPSRMAGSSTSNMSEVRPMVDEILGEKTFPDLESLPELPDIVDVFRAAGHVPAIVESCIKLGIRNLWLQQGIAHEEAAQRASEAGITVVMDRCMWRDAVKLGVRPA